MPAIIKINIRNKGLQIAPLFLRNSQHINKSRYASGYPAKTLVLKVDLSTVIPTKPKCNDHKASPNTWNNLSKTWSATILDVTNSQKKKITNDCNVNSCNWALFILTKPVLPISLVDRHTIVVPSNCHTFPRINGSSPKEINHDNIQLFQ